MTTPRSLVTGGAGFIGSHLVDRLLYDGHEVVVLDDLSGGEAAHLARWRGSPRLALIEHDVAEPWPHLMRFDRVFHLAGSQRDLARARDATMALRVVTEGTLRALRFAQASRARFFLASTPEVAGEPPEGPESEAHRGRQAPPSRAGLFVDAKRTAESMAWSFALERGLDIRIARIFSTYGPRMDLDGPGPMAELLRRTVEGRLLHVDGDPGAHIRACWVGDLVEGIVRHAEAPAPPRTLNLGSDAPIPLVALARFLCARGAAGQGHAGGGQDERTPCLSRARAALGFHPRVSWEEGVTRFLEQAAARPRMTRVA